MLSKFTISIPKIGMLLFVYLYGFLNSSYQLNAQNIPDANFASAIRDACPTCIDASNNLLPPAASLTFLTLFNKNISDLTGIQGFTGLKEFYCNNNNLTILPPLPSKLERFYCNNNQLTGLSTLPIGLKTLSCYGNLMYCLPALPTGLSDLYIDANKIKCLPNTVAGLKVYDTFSNNLTIPVCTEACSTAPCTPPATPSLTASPSTIKIGESSTLTAANCAGTVTWTTGQTGNSITVIPTPTSSSTFRAYCTVNGCSSGYSMVNVSIACEVPTPSLLATPGTISVGDSSTLTATGCSGTITWFSNSSGSYLGTGTTLKVKPTQSTNYNASCSIGGCSSSASVQVTVPCSVPSPNVSASPSTMSAGTSSTLTATGCTGTINWYNSTDGGPSIGTGNTLTVSPTKTTNYYSNCTINTCTSNNSYVQVTIPCSVPTPGVSASPATISVGQSATLTATGCNGTVTWGNSTGGPTIGTGSSITVSPTKTSEYYSYCSTGNCQSGASFVRVTVPCNSPTPSVSANPSLISAGASSTLTATGCGGTLTWYNSTDGGASLGSSSSITVSPTKTTSYYAYCTVDGCTGGNAFTQVIVPCSVTKPSVSANPSLISIGTSSTLTAAGCAGTVSWYRDSPWTSIGTGNTISVNPTTTTAYVARCALNGCSSNGESKIMVSVTCSIPATPSLTINPRTVPIGQSAVLTATNCTGTVTWNTGQTGNSITVTNVSLPANAFSTYSATCSVNGCSSDNSEAIMRGSGNYCVTPATPSIIASENIITAGQNVTLTANNCSGIVKWFIDEENGRPIVGEGSSINVNPMQSTRYVAYCVADGCGSDAAYLQITIPCQTPPTPIVTANRSIIRAGESATLSASGCAGIVTWGGVQTGTGNTLTVTPNNNSYYYARCTVNNCMSEKTEIGIEVACIQPTTPILTVQPNTIKAGESSTLTATGCAGTVRWFNSSNNALLNTGNTVTVSPTQSNSYYANCTVNNCTSSNAFVRVTIGCDIPPTPSVLATPNVIKAGESATLTATGCAGTVTWFGAGIASGTVGNSLTVTLSQAVLYNAQCTINGCTSAVTSAYVNVSCSPPPTPSLLATPSSIKSGQSSTLTASGCAGTVNWYSNTGGSSIGMGNSIIVSPAQSNSYYAVCVVNNCSSRDANVYISVTCDIPPTPSVVASPSAVSVGQSTTLTATNCAGTTTWFKSGTVTSIGTGNSITAVVTQSSYYYAYCTVNGCQSNSTGTNVNVLCAVPPTPSVSATPNSISSGQSATLTATGCTGTVTWYNAAGGAPLGTGNSFVVSPLNLTTYTAYCNVNSCSSGGANVEVVVATNPCPPAKTLTGIVSTPSPITEAASLSIESTQIIQPGTNVIYRSPVILLKPGTEIQQGAIFKTEQGGCK